MKQALWMVMLHIVLGGVLQGQVIRAQVPSSPFETVTIIYTANTKGLHAGSQTEAPASALDSIISALRKERRNSILVDLGNFMGPTPSTILTQGKLDFQVLELLGYDLIHLSSDDFVIGTDNINLRVADTKIPVLTGNLDLMRGGGDQWTILRCGNRRVGFVGVTSALFTNLVMARMRKDVVIETAADYLKIAIEEMAGKADIIVALTDLNEDEIAAIRSQPGLDLILTTGGDFVKPGADWISTGFPAAKTAVVARTLSPGTAVHVLEIHGYSDQDKWTVDKVTGEIYPINKNTPRENAVDNWLQWQLDSYIDNSSTVLGKLAQPLSSAGRRTQPTALGGVIADLMRNYTRSHVAILRAGSIRKGLPQGAVTEWNLIDAVPDPNGLVVVTMTGAQINALVAKSLTKTGQDGFLQFSGLTVDPFGFDNRIGGLTIVNNRQYTVTMSEFLAQGGDGYIEFKDAPVVRRLSVTLQTLCRRAFQKYGTLEVPYLPMDSEFNDWAAMFHIGGALNGFVADPQNAKLYPNEVELLGQQLLNASVTARLDINRTDFVSGWTNFVESEYGLSWNPDWIPAESLNTVQVGTQYSLYLSNLLFGGVKTLDPYVSAVLETTLIYPNRSNVLYDPTIPRPGTLKVAAGVQETALWKPAVLQIGVQWQKQPFAWSIPAITGLDCQITYTSDITAILGFDTSTDAFSAFNFREQGITVSSVNHIFFSLQPYLRIGPRIQLFYNSLVGHLSYLFDVSLNMDLTLGGT